MRIRLSPQHKVCRHSATKQYQQRSCQFSELLWSYRGGSSVCQSAFSAYVFTDGVCFWSLSPPPTPRNCSSWRVLRSYLPPLLSMSLVPITLLSRVTCSQLVFFLPYHFLVFFPTKLVYIISLPLGNCFDLSSLKLYSALVAFYFPFAFPV